MLKRGVISVCGFLAVAVACKGHGSSPSSSTAAPGVAPSLSGTWTAEYRIVDCWSSRPWHCPPPGSRAPLALMLDDQMPTISGFVVALSTNVPVEGSVNEGMVLLSGRDVSPDPDDAITEIREMRLQQGKSADLFGRFEVRQSNSPVPLIITAEFTTDKRAPLSGIDEFFGSWAGRYVVRSCQNSGMATACNARERVGWTETFDLRLEQSGSELRGHLKLGDLAEMSVTGQLSGAGANLTAGDRGISPFTLIGGSVTRTRVGALSGTLSYHVVKNSASAVVTVELSNVIRRP